MRALAVLPDFHPSNHVRAIRWSAMAPLLAERGVELHLVVPAWPWITAAPPELFGERGIRSLRTVGAPSSSTAARARRVLHAYRIPDRAAPHWRRQLAEVLRAAEVVGPDVVLTSSPPHSLHLVGLALAEQGLRWIADFRDPYLGDPRFRCPRPLPPFGRRARRFDRAVGERAWLVVHAVGPAARVASQRHPDLAGKFVEVPNGAPIDAIGVAPPEDLAAVRPLRVTVIGNYGERELIALAEALARASTPAVLRVFGRVPSRRARARISRLVEAHLPGPVPHDRALAALVEPGLLVALLDGARGASGGLSSKLFEFIATGNPVLAVNPTEADRELLARYPRCAVSAGNPAAMASAVSELVRLPVIGRPELGALRESISRRAAVERLWSAMSHAGVEDRR